MEFLFCYLAIGFLLFYAHYSYFKSVFSFKDNLIWLPFYLIFWILIPLVFIQVLLEKALRRLGQ
jgi:hypothetical protein